MIIDTNAISALAEGDQILLGKLSIYPITYVTFINVGEFRFGIESSRSKANLKRWLDKFLEQTTLLFADLETITHYSAIRHEMRAAGTPIPASDLWIAALVRQHGMPIVSRDAHFDRVEGVKRVSW